VRNPLPFAEHIWNKYRRTVGNTRQAAAESEEKSLHAHRLNQTSAKHKLSLRHTAVSNKPVNRSALGDEPHEA
jgi:hypothetical protein